MNGYSERWLRQGFAWVYPAECTGARPRPGQRVRIRAANGDGLGAGIGDDGWIAVRRFRVDDGPLDRAWLASRVERAWALRRAAVPPDTTAWRLLHAENDDLPGIRVDVWGADPTGRAEADGVHLTITLDSASLVVLLDDLVGELVDRLSPSTIHLAWRPDPRDLGQRGWPERVAGKPAPKLGRILGDDVGPVEVRERGVRFRVDPAGLGSERGEDGVVRRRDCGLYPDMRDNRRWLDVGWTGARVLNLFAYTGAFSVFAALRGAAEVTTVDLSPVYLARARENFELNGLDPSRYTFVEEDAFRALDRLRRQGAKFDRVILDPPGHSHSPDGRWSGEQDYARAVSAVVRVLAPGGWLCAASNLGAVSPKQFAGALTDGARKAGSTLRVIHEGSQAADYPAALHFPEARYLKFFVAAVG